MTKQIQSFRDLLANDGYAATFQTMGQYRTALLTALRTASFQGRVEPWMLECFGAEIAADKKERNHRFLEEALELVQACGAAASEAHQLVDYVYGRPVGDKHQEAGGVMVTLAALCLAQGLDMHASGETELARIWTKVEQIRAKQAAKPKHSPLPEHVPAASPAPAQGKQDVQAVELELYRMAYGSTAPTDAAMDVLAERQRQIKAEGWTPEHDDDHGNGDLARAAGCYALYSARYYPPGNPPGVWPWAPEWWKPTERRRNLVKSAALVLAEIERIDRAAAREHSPANANDKGE